MKLADLYCKDTLKNMTGGSNQALRILVIGDYGIKVWCAAIIKKMFLTERIHTNIYFLDFGEIGNEQSSRLIIKCEYLLVWIPFQSICDNYKNDILSHKKTVDDILTLLKQKYQFLLSAVVNYGNPLRAMVSMEDYSDNMDYCNCMFYGSHRIADNLNAWLYENFSQSFRIMDIKQMIALVGIQKAYDFEMHIRTGFRYSPELLTLVCGNMLKHYMVEKRTPYKCLVLDCDNVLWGGIVSEVGIDGIRIGRSGAGKRYYEFQKVLLSLYYQGIILTVCSKNDKEDVLNVFDNHSGMLLTRDNITYFSVNWENKAQGICDISKYLGISLEQIVFVDDSVAEIEGIRWTLPMVKTIHFDSRAIYNELSCICLESENDIKAIELRNKTYKDNIKRVHLRQITNDYEEYLRQLEMKVSFYKMKPIEFQRVSELSRRANRFTNGNRLSVAELQSLYKEGSLYSIYVSDKYGDLGLSGAIVTVDTTLILVCMSCRAEGRNVEKKIKEFLKDNLTIKSIVRQNTGKNQKFIDFIKEIIQ